MRDTLTGGNNEAAVVQIVIPPANVAVSSGPAPCPARPSAGPAWVTGVLTTGALLQADETYCATFDSADN